MSRGHRVRILIAEDNKMNQLVAMRLLTRLGYESDVVSDGAEAVQAVLAQQYSAVLMDCHMPGTDGFAATMEIREREEREPRTPIIAMTSRAFDRDRDLCLAAGMDDYLRKPIRPEAVRSTLERWVVHTGEHRVELA